MKRILRLFSGERGFTLIEMIAGLALTGLIGLGVSVAILQVSQQTEYNTDYTTATEQAMSAVHWIGQDLQMAQTVSGTDGFPGSDNLVMSWKWWDNTEYTITYSLVDGVLRRTYDDGSDSHNTVVAQNVNDDPGLTYCASDNNTFDVSITIGLGTAQVTRSRGVAARPHL